jgi:hypothetical protein
MIVGKIKNISTKNLVSLDKTTHILIEIDNPDAYMSAINELASDKADTLYAIRFEKQD